MNRETKRLLQRQGQLDDEGNPSVGTRRQPPRQLADRRAIVERAQTENLFERTAGFLRDAPDLARLIEKP